jgi:hypothetical protein
MEKWTFLTISGPVASRYTDCATGTHLYIHYCSQLSRTGQNYVVGDLSLNWEGRMCWLWRGRETACHICAWWTLRLPVEHKHTACLQQFRVAYLRPCWCGQVNIYITLNKERGVLTRLKHKEGGGGLILTSSGMPGETRPTGATNCRSLLFCFLIVRKEFWRF